MPTWRRGRSTRRSQNTNGSRRSIRRIPTGRSSIPLSHYRLAKLYERKGLTAKAVERYHRFLFLWKDADKDLPEYADAKKRAAALSR